jgi:glycosyltransferase involved in cell wall biosynthesis
MPLLSLITINYNNAPGLKKTIDSVVHQSFKNFEYIVIDGGSTDNSTDYLSEYAVHISHQVSEKDEGIYNAMNKGIKAASGDYLLFLNSGDVLASADVLENVHHHLNGAEGIVYGDLQLLKNEQITTEVSPEKIGVYELMLSTIWHPTAFIKRDLFEKYGLYNENLKITADYEFFIRCIIKHKISTKHISVPITLFDLSGISNQQEQQQKQSLEREKSWQLNVSGFRYSFIKLYIWLKRRWLSYMGKL